MQYEVATPEDYLAALEDDWRKEKLNGIRELIKARAPELEETIHYKMLGYAHGAEHVLHLNAQKNYVSLYVGNVSKVDPEGKLLTKVNFGKGCVRFKKSVPLEETGVDRFLEAVFTAWRAGKDIGC